MKDFTAMLVASIALMTTVSCATSKYAVVNMVSVKEKHNKTIVTNTAQASGGGILHRSERLHPVRLGMLHSDEITINLLTTSLEYSPDPVLVDLALDHIQQNWVRLRKRYAAPRLSIDFWLLPQGTPFRHQNKSVMDPASTLDLTFVMDFSRDQPAIDGIAEFVDALSHELYHVSRLDQPADNALAEEVNAHAWGYCSKFGFALASGKRVVFRWHVQPSWQGAVSIDAGVLRVRTRQNTKRPVQRSQFGLAIFFQYLSAVVGSDGFDVSNATQAAAIERLCSHIEEDDLKIIAAVRSKTQTDSTGYHHRPSRSCSRRSKKPVAEPFSRTGRPARSVATCRARP